MTRVHARKKNINLRSVLNAVSKVINMKFGVEVFAEKSLRCIKAEYLLMQTLCESDFESIIYKII